jgi:sugar lactone lactonase YvrE
MEFTPAATGFCLLEAPRVDARGVWFSDILLGGVRCLRPDGRIDAWLTERRFIGGIAMNADGRLVCAGPGGLVWLDPQTGATGVLLDRIDGQPIPGINDITPAPDGGLYFGTVDHPAIMEGRPIGPSALYRLAPDGRVTLIRDGVVFANGMGLSPDKRTLYHNDSSVGTFAYEVAPDGSVSEGGLIRPDDDGDGLAVDVEGGIWVAGILTGGLTRFWPDGTVERRVPVPGGNVTSLGFGGPDGRDLYVTTTAPGAGEASLRQSLPEVHTATLFHARSDVAGVTIGETAFSLPG